MTARAPGHVRGWVVLGLALAALLVLVALVAGSWAASSVLLVPKHEPPRTDVAVLAVRTGQVELARTAATARPGEYGLEGAGIHAIVGSVAAQSSDSVTRRLLQSSGGLHAGARVAVDPGVFAGDPMQALGFPFQDVSVPGQLGSMPAWLVPGSAATWAIFVLGIDWASMNEVADARDFRLPILLFQGLDDPLVPPANSAAFARALPGPVTFVTVPGAGHVQSWNLDPAAYDARVRTFLAPAA